MSRTTGRATIAIIRQGDRPRLNARLAELVGSVYPDDEIDDIDVLAAVLDHPARRLGVTAAAAIEHGPDLVRRRISPKRAMVRSAAFASAVRRVVADRVDPATHRFTFQSQSLFDGHVPGVPHFVYTDHAHLANLGYPAFDPDDLEPRRFLRREVDLYRAATAVFTRSEHVRDVLVHGYGCAADAVHVVGVGPNIPIPPPRPDDAWYGGRILFIGVDWHRKGGDVLVAAFEQVRRRHPTARLEIVGCDPEGVGGAGIHVHGRLAPASVADLASNCDVFCLPTRIEPFGVAFIEAMGAGLPVVGTRIGAIPDFTVPGETGELVEPDDVQGLVDALDRMLADPVATRSAGRRARELAERRYDWGPVMTTIRGHIDEHLTRRSR